MYKPNDNSFVIFNSHNQLTISMDEIAYILDSPKGQEKTLNAYRLNLNKCFVHLKNTCKMLDLLHNSNYMYDLTTLMDRLNRYKTNKPLHTLFRFNRIAQFIPNIDILLPPTHKQHNIKNVYVLYAKQVDLYVSSKIFYLEVLSHYALEKPYGFTLSQLIQVFIDYLLNNGFIANDYDKQFIGKQILPPTYIHKKGLYALDYSKSKEVNEIVERKLNKAIEKDTNLNKMFDLAQHIISNSIDTKSQFVEQEIKNIQSNISIGFN